MLSSNMLLPNLIPLINVTFSTPMPVINTQLKSLFHEPTDSLQSKRADGRISDCFTAPQRISGLGRHDCHIRCLYLSTSAWATFCARGRSAWGVHHFRKRSIRQLPC